MTTHMLEALFKAEHPTPSLADALKFICERWGQLRVSRFELPELDDTDFECFYECREIPEGIRDTVLTETPMMELMERMLETMTETDVYDHFGSVCLARAPIDELLEAAIAAIEDGEEPDPELMKKALSVLLP